VAALHLLVRLRPKGLSSTGDVYVTLSVTLFSVWVASTSLLRVLLCLRHSTLATVIFIAHV
jgi:hypothetical protein